MPREQTPAEITSFLMRGTRTAKVATTMPGGQPHVMPVWFVLDGDDLVFGSTRSRPFTATNVRRKALAAWKAENDRRVKKAEESGEKATLVVPVTPGRTGTNSRGRCASPRIVGFSR